jgi:thiamine pyrophosphate-dependent acetolactate synthase large subunit-like protein
VQVAAAVAEILKREGTEFLIGYPVNPIIEAAAEADIRTIIVRQERTGLHMADAVSRVSSGDRIGVFCMQHGPGTRAGSPTCRRTSRRCSTSATSPSGPSK